MHPSGTPRHPVVLIILDGFGCNPSKVNNAVIEANTPNFDTLFSHHPHTTINASGLAVGLPDGQMGNSEVGHMTLGCGSIVKQDLVKLDNAIHDQSFFENKTLISALLKAKQKKRPIHLMGLLSDGGIHSHIRHVQALIQLCIRHQVPPALHIITDGRDTMPKAALTYLKQISPILEKSGGHIATISGRYYAMDRDNRWDRTEKAWQAFRCGSGEQAETAEQAIQQAYSADITDEFILPTIIHGAELLDDQDELIFFNFRKDRPRQMLASLFKPDFSEFNRDSANGYPNVTCLMEYDQWFKRPYAFEHDKPVTTLSNIISRSGLKQFHCAETEKYAHVTYFFNGGRGDTFPGEYHHVIPSPKVATYDLQPEMSANEVANTVIAAINSQEHAFIVVNFANGDMVGHTAIKSAVIQAVETLDAEASRVIDAAIKQQYSVILTSDHGNCDELIAPSSQTPHTQHSTYPVPCLLIDKAKWTLSTQGGLANIAPTVLHLMGLGIPNTMSACSLLLKT